MGHIYFTDELHKVIKRVRETEKPETIVSEGQKLTTSLGRNLSGIPTVYITSYSPKVETRIEVPPILDFNLPNLANLKFHDTGKNILSELKKNKNKKDKEV